MSNIVETNDTPHVKSYPDVIFHWLLSLHRVPCWHRTGGGVWVQMVEHDAGQHEELCLQSSVQWLWPAYWWEP